MINLYIVLNIDVALFLIQTSAYSLLWHSRRIEEKCFLLGIRLIARRGRRTRNVRIADKLMFSAWTQYSTALKASNTSLITRH